MIQIKLIPETACLTLMMNNQLINSKFYNKLAFDCGGIDKAQMEADTQEMVSEYLKTHIGNMLEEFEIKDRFNIEDIETLMQLADYTENGISKLINKFHYVNTRIADNGGAPILKQILKLI